MLKILIDAGHGAGAAHNRGGVCFNEGDNNYHFSLVLKAELEKYGVQVGLTRTNINQNPELHVRSKMGEGYDLFLSQHSNAAKGTARGTEVWDSVEKPNKVLAQALVDAISNVFGHNNRGVKYRVGQPGYNYYGVLRFNPAKSSMIIENGFHDNVADCNFFKNNHEAIAAAQAKVIAEHYGLRSKASKNTVPSSSTGSSFVSGWLGRTPIKGEPTATIQQMEAWAIAKKAHPTFIDLAPVFYGLSVEKGINPVLTYAQSAKETGYFKFGGVLNATFNNPCGMKTSKGGADKNPNAHQRFTSWREGIQAQVDHLMLYTGTVIPGTPDPRHFPYIAKSPINYVEQLSGKWAGSRTYGQEIVTMMKEIEQTNKESRSLKDVWKGWKLW